MKKITKILSFLLALVFTMSLFTACGDDPVVVEEGEKVTIQWVYGQKLLKEEEVDKGSKITPWTPVEEGKEFQGWYERPYIKKFDFDKVKATKSMRIYASFTSGDDSDGGEYEVPDWYLIGAGKGDLNKANNWNHEAAARYLGLYAGEDGIYRVTLNLYAGDQFKMTKDFGWDAEMAIDKMAGFADGSVKDADGNLVFVAGENNNFVVADGADGKYEITFDPNTALMGFTKLEALETLPDDIRLIGDNNGWGTSYGEDDFKFTTTDNTTWTYTWEVTSLPATFKVYNNSSGVYYPGGVDNDLHIDEVGTYTITFNSKTRNIVVTDANGNNVDVGFTGDSGNSGGGSGTTGTPSTEALTVYFQNNWLWTNVACHYWGDGITGSEFPGAAMTNVGVNGGYDVYSIELPVGTTGFLFTGTKNDGSGATDQSPDISVDGVVNGQGFKMLWNGANAVEGFTYDPSACNHNYVNGVCDKCGAGVAYTIAGTGAHLGTEWDPSNTSNDMEYDAATGNFKKVYTNVAAGDYKFKVTKDHSWAVNWGVGGPNGGDIPVNVPNDGATLTIIFDGNTVTFTVE